MDVELFKKYKASTGRQAQRILNRLVASEMPLVMKCVSKYSYRGQETLEDLVQAGSVGLVRAIEKWDPTRGTWSSFAFSWILESIHRSASLEDMIRIKNKKFDLPVFPSVVLGDIVEMADRPVQIEKRIDLKAALEVLNVRERRIVIGRVIEEKTLLEVAREEGLTEKGVEYIELRALAKMRAKLTRKS